MVKGRVSKAAAVLMSIVMWVVMLGGMPEMEANAAWSSVAEFESYALQNWTKPILAEYADPNGGSRYFGANRSGTDRKHAANDYVCAVGTPVYAMTGGYVEEFSGNFYAGTQAISVKNDDGSVARYCEIGTSLRSGDRVEKGQQIGTVIANTSSAKSHMLHLELYLGTASGSLSNTSNNTYWYVESKKYCRRQDLLDPTFLQKLGGYVPPPPTPSLATPTISTDKSSYNVGDTVYLSWTASPSGSNLSHYWLNVIAPDGTWVYGGTMNKVTSYSFVASQSGNYSVTTYATPIGSKEGEDSLTDTKTIAVNNATCTVKFVDYPTNYESSKTVTVGDAYGTLPTLTRAGYTFCGWYRESNGKGEVTSSTIVSNTADHSLYAQWKVADNAPDYPIADYYADLNFDGKYSVFDISIIREIVNGNKIPTVMEKIYADLNGDGFVDQQDADVISRIYLYTMDDKEVRTAFNKWKTRYLDTVYYLIPLDTEYVDFFSISIKQGHQYGTLPTASREGYIFDGWYADGTTLINSSSIFTVEDYPNSTGGMSSYCAIDAGWTAKKYTVTFDAQGGSCSTTSRTVQYDSTYGSLPTPTRQGYSFNGWYDNNDVAITSSTIYKIASNQVLYAHWTANSYTVSFDSNGGSCSETKRTVFADETYGTLPEPTRTGYNFDGWYTFPFNGIKIEANDIFDWTGDLTLFAHWTPRSCFVSFNSMDIGSDALSSAILYPYDTKSGQIESPSEMGYEYDEDMYDFEGWFTEEIGGTRIEYYEEIVGTVDLYAHWKKIGTSVSLYGDVDCNGVVDIMDAILLNRNLMIGAEISEQGLANADVDNSGSADAVDSLNVLKAVVRLITLPV